MWRELEYGIWSRLYGSFPSALNTWSKVWPLILIWAYLIWNFAPIFGQQISILDPPYIGLFGPSWSELSPYGWIAGGGGSIGPRIRFFITDRNVTTYVMPPRRSVWEARLKMSNQVSDPQSTLYILSNFSPKGYSWIVYMLRAIDGFARSTDRAAPVGWLV